MKAFCLGWIPWIVLLSASSARAQPAAAAFKPPEEIAFRQATIISEGSRLGPAHQLLSRSLGTAR
jgi:hypothetical protein